MNFSAALDGRPAVVAVDRAQQRAELFASSVIAARGFDFGRRERALEGGCRIAVRAQGHDRIAEDRADDAAQPPRGLASAALLDPLQQVEQFRPAVISAIGRLAIGAARFSSSQRFLLRVAARRFVRLLVGEHSSATTPKVLRAAVVGRVAFSLRWTAGSTSRSSRLRALVALRPRIGEGGRGVGRRARASSRSADAGSGSATSCCRSVRRGGAGRRRRRVCRAFRGLAFLMAKWERGIVRVPSLRVWVRLAANRTRILAVQQRTSCGPLCAPVVSQIADFYGIICAAMFYSDGRL